MSKNWVLVLWRLFTMRSRYFQNAPRVGHPRSPTRQGDIAYIEAFLTKYVGWKKNAKLTLLVRTLTTQTEWIWFEPCGCGILIVSDCLCWIYFNIKQRKNTDVNGQYCCSGREMRMPPSPRFIGVPRFQQWETIHYVADLLTPVTSIAITFPPRNDGYYYPHLATHWNKVSKKKHEENCLSLIQSVMQRWGFYWWTADRQLRRHTNTARLFKFIANISWNNCGIWSDEFSSPWNLPREIEMMDTFWSI